MRELWFPDILREMNMMAVVFRLFCCILCGGLLGIEREWRHRTAGLKTHVVVCMGAAICMMIGQYAILYFDSKSIDPTRIGAQVVSGIGFLGVGTIIVTNNAKVKGLTTAAGLWVSACIGLAIGIGFYELALLSTLFMLAFFIGVKKWGIFGGEKEIQVFLYVELRDISDVRKIMDLLQESDCSVFQMNMQESKLKTQGGVGMVLGVRGERQAENEIVQLISKQEYVLGFMEMEN